MPIHLIGEHMPGTPPFDRSFFTTALGNLLGRLGERSAQKLTLFLSDGSTLEACNIEELGEDFLVLRAYKGENHCDLAVEVIPYGLIYRVQISSKSSEDDERVGFKWTPQQAAPPKRAKK